MELLVLFSWERPRLTLNDLASMTGMPKATMLRLLRPLCDARLLEQDPKDRSYRLGYRWIELGELVRQTSDLRQIAIAPMRELQRLTNETVHLAVLSEEWEPFYLEKIESDQPVRYWTRVGQRLPLHAGAAGKILAAHLPRDIQRCLLFERPLERFTERTITDPDLLMKHLAEARKRGWIDSEGELYDGVLAVAAPIFDVSERAVGSISVGGPSSRFDRKKMQEVVPLLLECVGTISRQLGYGSAVLRGGGTSRGEALLHRAIGHAPR